jgi:hypothetical protein
MVVSFSALKKNSRHRVRDHAFASRKNADPLRFRKAGLQIDMSANAALGRRADAAELRAYAMRLRSAAPGVQIKSHSDKARSL